MKARLNEGFTLKDFYKVIIIRIFLYKNITIYLFIFLGYSNE
ncbi:hypothetical protein JHL18_04810 [Clostridium sp. YIM B02505]|uniref:Uncharacterized protein n=1 Tax=Clostridium yunnanense TaxID=2800325 RepID=A0ABS1EKR2_9CLOT|nr:hypothetical protein [Clostridium yunnanense]